MHAAERVDCELCHAEAPRPCTDEFGFPLSNVHQIRLTDYKNKVNYEESVWLLHTDDYAEMGLPSGTELVGWPHWYQKREIIILSVNGDLSDPPNFTVSADHLYWVRWYDTATVSL